MANIELLKQIAIEETITFFNERCGINPERDKLLKLLEGEKDYIDTQLKHNSGLIKRGRKSELLTELEGYITEGEKVINKIRLNDKGYVTNSKPENLLNNFCLLTFYYLFHSEQLIEINNSESEPKADILQNAYEPPTDTTGTQNPEQETNEEKIKRILEPLRGAFDDNTHIYKIIDAFVNCKAGERLPKVKKAILRMDMKEFIQPFGRLFADGLFKRGEISKTLLFYIEKNTLSGNVEYSEVYINKLLSVYKSNYKHKSNTKV